MSSTLYDRAQDAVRAIRKRSQTRSSIAVVLGSGLGRFAEELSERIVIPYDEIPGFAKATVAGHAGRLILGKSGSIPIVALQGRFHFHEGHSMPQVTFPIRVLKLLGIDTVILTNAAGAVNPDFTPASFMVIKDHISLMVPNPLVGENDERFGQRFPDMTSVYDVNLQNAVIEEAVRIGLKMYRGVYAALPGPSYETPAEIRMLRTLGADAVGMSTVPEAIVARQMNMNVIGVSCITNSTGVSERPLDHNDVIAIGESMGEQFADLLRGVVERIQ